MLPLFADQPDNARRITQRGYGTELDPFNSTKEEFEEAIEFCLTNAMKDKMQKMSNRMKIDNNLRAACESIVNLLK